MSVDGEVLPPLALTGDFYVLSFSREDDAFTLYVDDEAQSSYALGDQAKTMQYLKRVGGSTYDLAVNHAMQFGVVQVIPREKRVISLHNRASPLDLFAKANTDACHLPAL